MKPFLKRAGVTVAAVLIALLAIAPAASAHIIADSVEPVGDGSVTITFVFNHSCPAAPTTGLQVQMPAGASALTAEGPPGWDAVISNNTAEMSGPPIATDVDVAFTVTARLTGQPGETLLFPTDQTCSDGDVLRWTDPDEASDEPAPRIIATTAVLDLQPAAAGGGGASAWEIAVGMAVLTAVAAGLAARLRRRVTE